MVFKRGCSWGSGYRAVLAVTNGTALLWTGRYEGLCRRAPEGPGTRHPAPTCIVRNIYGAWYRRSGGGLPSMAKHGQGSAPCSLSGAPLVTQGVYKSQLTSKPPPLTSPDPLIRGWCGTNRNTKSLPASSGPFPRILPPAVRVQPCRHSHTLELEPCMPGQPNPRLTELVRALSHRQGPHAVVAPPAPLGSGFPAPGEIRLGGGFDYLLACRSSGSGAC